MLLGSLRGAWGGQRQGRSTPTQPAFIRCVCKTSTGRKVNVTSLVVVNAASRPRLLLQPFFLTFLVDSNLGPKVRLWKPLSWGLREQLTNLAFLKA